MRLKDFNDYAEVTRAFEPLLKLSRATGATLLLLHHGSAHQPREGLDAVLGSTALSGSVDNILILKRTDQQRVLSSVQRIGPDLEPTVIVLNADTGRLERAGRKRDVDDAELGSTSWPRCRRTGRHREGAPRDVEAQRGSASCVVDRHEPLVQGGGMIPTATGWQTSVPKNRQTAPAPKNRGNLGNLGNHQ